MNTIKISTDRKMSQTARKKRLFLMISICLIKQEPGLFVESQGNGSYRKALRRWWNSV